MFRGWKRRYVSMRSSRMARGQELLKAAGVFVLLVAAACSSTENGAKAAAIDRASSEANETRKAPGSATNDAEGAFKRQPGPASTVSLGDLPTEALALLGKSVAESCAVCVREMRAEAFAMLDDHYSPGTLLASDAGTRFTRRADAPGELVLARGDSAPGRLYSLEASAMPALTFRYHTDLDHLVGVAASDRTESGVTERLAAAPAGALFEGVFEVVPFAYGDGAAFRYSPAKQEVQIHCRIVELRPLTP